MTTAISASLVKDLRERTGAGMMECKRALQESHGDIEKAIEAMRKSGQAKADKKADRIAAEGVIVIRISDDQKRAIILEVNSETDFVSRDVNFLNFANLVADTAISKNIESLENLLTASVGNETVDETRKHLVAKIGENIQVRRFAALKSNHIVGGYVHGGRIGALIELEGGDAALGKDIAMHIVANNPLVVNPSEVSVDLINKEKEIFSAQAATSGKPANIIEKMVEGRIKKYLDEISLVGQPYVKDPDNTVGKILESHKAKPHHFVRFKVGEGIEKKTENFAEEVMAQVRGS
ncbi:MAG TPA: translation elongation factor Ts [Gammaproteobacteria bacterium]|nr:translation elongation factor Ts [Gammaproteobacteria bacterium]